MRVYVLKTQPGFREKKRIIILITTKVEVYSKEMSDRCHCNLYLQC